MYTGACRIQGLGGSRFKVSGSGLRLGFRDLGVGCRIEGLSLHSPKLSLTPYGPMLQRMALRTLV